MTEQQQSENQHPEANAKPKHSEEKAGQLSTGKFNGLFNAWTVIGTILLAFAGVFFSIGHIILAFIATGIGITFYLVALHFELREKYGQKSRFISPILGLVCWTILTWLAWPPSSGKPSVQRPTSQSQIFEDTVHPTHSITVPDRFGDEHRRQEISAAERLTLRAYVDIDRTRPFDHIFNVGERVRVLIPCLNSCSTPAYKHYHVVKIFWEHDRFPTLEDSIEISQILERHKHDGITVGPKRPVDKYVDSDSIFSKGDSLTLSSGNAILYVIGAMTYLDSFREPHRTWYCVFYDPIHRRMITYNRFNGTT